MLEQRLSLNPTLNVWFLGQYFFAWNWVQNSEIQYFVPILGGVVKEEKRNFHTFQIMNFEDIKKKIGWPDSTPPG